MNLGSLLKVVLNYEMFCILLVSESNSQNLDATYEGDMVATPPKSSKIRGLCMCFLYCFAMFLTHGHDTQSLSQSMGQNHLNFP